MRPSSPYPWWRGLLVGLAFSTLMLAATTSVTVSPTAPSIRLNATQQFTASVSVTNNTSKAVTWYVNDVKNGNATLGTIDATGKYTAPATLPNPATVTVKAVSDVDVTKSGTASLTLLNLQPTISAIAPGYVNVGTPFSLVVTGTNFLAGSTVTLNGVAVTSRFDSPTQLTVTGTGAGTATSNQALVVTNPNAGTANNASRNVQLRPAVTVTLQFTTRTLRGGTTTPNTATVRNHDNTAVTWAVNNVTGGNAFWGTINSSGLYTAPVTPPTGGTVTIKATSVADPRVSATATYTLQNPIPVLTSVTDTIKIGTYALTVKGSNFVKDDKVFVAGLPVDTQYVSETELRATGTIAAQLGGLAAVQVQVPNDTAAISGILAIKVVPATVQVPLATAVRMLNQATWGPDPESVAHLQEVGIPKFISEQLAAPPSDFPAPPLVDDLGNFVYFTTLYPTFTSNALYGKDQLRQRVAFALHNILVVSAPMVDGGRARAMHSYWAMLNRDAFGNYRDLLRDLTLNPAMGQMLSMVNNRKADPRTGTVANENYAREVLQLFSIGLVQLNPDGSATTTPTYSEDTVKEFAKVFTGWTYATQPGATPKWTNPTYWDAPMEPNEAYHDTGAKTLLDGVTLSPGGTARQDLEAALDNIFNHPNVGPFVSQRLIQRLVTSNPSPAYVSRVARIFNNNGRGVRGDLASVVRAILIDPEAGVVKLGITVAADPNGPPVLAANQGHLREPVLLILNAAKTFGWLPTETLDLGYRAGGMNQTLFAPPSVFGYFSPGFRIPNTGGVGGPEFQNVSVGTVIRMGNNLNGMFTYAPATTRFNFTALEALANDPDLLITALDNALLGGTMTAEQRRSLVQAITAIRGNNNRARRAAYLVTAFTDYAIQR